MNKADLIYKQNLQRILDEGCWDENPRPRYETDGAPAHSKFITQVFEEYDISKGELPITTLRPIVIGKAIQEMLWIYQDQTSDLKVLRDKYSILWWNQWGLKDDTIGQRYGATVSKYDLMNQLLNRIANDFFGRRHIISLWQEQDFKDTEGLPPCAFQTIWSGRKVNGEKYLDCTLIQRSSDYPTAGHINMMQYVALMMMVAHHLGIKVGKFARFTQNLHMYSRHEDQVREMLQREPSTETPQLILNAEGKSFYEIEATDFKLINYNPVRPQLKFELGI
ncbi:thymidylate synthase [Bacillus phage vB_BanS_Skywalker]|uniref:thymidylate synthase n=2 Tax=Tsamsavirus TaxID=3044849 RepID=A0AAE9CEN2_9CAUD|nr:thymidylate synthase [Bacillus phage vB_BanS_Skywalker]YP_010681065.1 thymidylate synthase [Bacillus phage vB_BanS_MrDarsey]UGO48001.1 thymidylate synthase [Bacillus phage vB_BanS_MrDarsey]UGO51256.1 thymidylate synthase [Bacillus phage vB_BanS_Skywalker]